MEGGCYCRAIRFRIEEDPTWVGACHCIDCRKISGAPYTVWAGFKNNNFEVLKGEPKKFHSSKNVIRSFCEVCSSSCTFVYIDQNVTEENDLVYFPIGFFDEPTKFEVQEHIWVSQKLSYIEIPPDELQREE